MLFRIVAPHTHQARAAAGVFTCLRVLTAGELHPQISWSVYLGEVVLKTDCRTLNEAKQVCRREAAARQGNGATATPATNK